MCKRRRKTYRALDPDKVVETIGQLRHRIVERFPGAGLGEVCAELLLLAGENSARVEKMRQRNIPLRFAIIVLLVAGTAALVWVVRLFRPFRRPSTMSTRCCRAWTERPT